MSERGKVYFPLWLKDDFFKYMATRLKKYWSFTFKVKLNGKFTQSKLCLTQHFIKRIHNAEKLILRICSQPLTPTTQTKGQMCRIINNRMHFLQKRFSSFLWHWFYAMRVDREILDKISIQCFTYRVLFLLILTILCFLRIR